MQDFSDAMPANCICLYAMTTWVAIHGDSKSFLVVVLELTLILHPLDTVVGDTPPLAAPEPSY